MDEEFRETSELIELSEIKGMVRRHRWRFLSLFFVGWLLVWGISWAIPSLYRSGTLILVEQAAVPEKIVVSNIDIDIQRQLDSITQQILSRTRLLTIIDHQNLYAEERKRMSDDVVVEKMQKDIDIELVRSGDTKKLSAFNIYYSSAEPQTAQRTTNELAKLFIAENLEQRQERSENTTKFLEEQLNQARQSLSEQEARVREFKDKHIGELPTQTAANLQILAGLQGQLQARQDSLNRAKQQNAYMESLLGQYRAMGQTGKPGEMVPGGLVAIDRELDRLKAQLADLSSHYTDKHPDVRKTKEQIARTERMREKFVAEINDAPNTAELTNANLAEPKSAALLELESQLKANRVEITSHEAAIQDLQAKVAQYQGRLNMAPVMEQQFADLTRDYDQTKANYDSLLAKRNQSEMATSLERTQQAEHFRMLDPPNLPTRPYKPKRLQLCGVGLLVGLAFGGAVSFGKEKFSGNLYSERAIKKLIPYHVIAEIPPIETAQEQAAHRRQIWFVSLAAIIVTSVILLGSAVTYLYG